ncbi:MAG TPA: phosphodiesterase [Candidatus Methylomirabilis sp.]|nr:phosphodiesterase [Candidatus Methylomirabilis sp.]
MIIAQISDLHICPPGVLAYRRVDTAALLSRCVEQIGRMTPRPDLVLATGDLVDRGRPDEYRHLRELLAPLSVPVYLIPGNHDERGALAREFSEHTYLPREGKFLHYVLEQYPVRLICLDTLIPGEGGGEMCEERLAWLGARLAEAPARPTVIAMHHAPFLTGIAHMDRVGLDNGEPLGRLVERHPQVERVLCGHLHRPIQLRWHGTVVMTAPSTAHQVVLDLREDSPAEFIMEPPAFMVHVWREGTGLLSHTSYVGDFAGPFAFHPAQ